MKTNHRRALRPTPGLITTLLPLLAIAPTTQGATTTIAISGQQAPGTPSGAVFGQFTSNHALNDAGQVTFEGSLRQNSSAGVDLTNDRGLWRDNTLVAREGSQAPGTPTGSVFDDHPHSFVLNDEGQTLYDADLRIGSGGVDSTNNNGYWLDQALIARKGSQAGDLPSGVVFDFLGSLPVLNNMGQAAYSASLRTGSGGVDLTNNDGIWRDNTLIAREDSQAPALPSGAVFSFFGPPVLNNAGQVAFTADLKAFQGGVDSTNDSGIWRDNLLIAREGDQAGGAPTGAVFDRFDRAVAINDSGQIAYGANLDINQGGVDPTNDAGIWRDKTLIVREGEQAGGTPTGAVFEFFRDLVLNNAGQIAYQAQLQMGLGGVAQTNNVGIWRDNTLIAREGEQAPGTPPGAVFSNLGKPMLNDQGQVAYSGNLRTGSGGVDETNNTGIWITGPNGHSLLVARKGDTLDGRTINLVTFSDSDGSGGSDGRSRSLNNASQLVYRAVFNNGDRGIFLFTLTDLHWINPASGNWGDTGADSNWTIGQQPGERYDVFVDPKVSLTVTGPTEDVTLKSLRIGGNNGIATLSLSGGDITSTSGVLVTPTGILTGDGVINGNVENHGQIVANNVTFTDIPNNFGIISGSGRINIQFMNNQPAGEIRVGSGDHLTFTKPDSIFVGVSNAGRIEVIGQDHLATVEFDQPVDNLANTGMIFARGDAALRFNAGLTNHGSVALAFTNATLLGDITNTATGRIAISDGSRVVFNDDVTNNGVIDADTGASVVFFGDYSGDGVTGAAHVKMFGDLKPGASPAAISFGGSLTLAPTALLEAELAGTNPGSGANDHDQINVTSNVTLDGTLDITLLDGFTPDYSDTFDILTYATRSGVFQQVTGHFLSPELALGQFYDDANGVLQLLATAPGDANGDLIVDISDFGVLAGNFNQPGTWETGDFDGNGITNINDFGLLAANFNGDFNTLTAAATELGITIPEPGAAALWGVVIVGWLGQQRPGGSSGLCRIA